MCMCVFLLLGGAFGSSSVSAEDARAELLVRVLSSSPSFRVRAQAAVALSHMEAAPRTLAALRASLRDEHPVVREACTAALASLEGPARAKPTPARASDKYYVHVGEPSAKTAIDPGTLKAMHEHVVNLVARLDGVRLAPDGEDQRTAKRVLERDALIGFSVESVVNELERRGDSVRVNVSVVVATYPGRNIQAMLTGSANVSGRGNDDGAQRKAAEVAFASAMRRLSGVLDASRLEARVSTPDAPRARVPRD